MGHRLSPRAEADLDEIWYYIATSSGSPETADRFLESIAARFELLAGHSNVGRRRDELGGGLRSFSVGDYVVFYRKEQEDIRIVRILHGRRDIPSLFGG